MHGWLVALLRQETVTSGPSNLQPGRCGKIWGGHGTRLPVGSEDILVPIYLVLVTKIANTSGPNEFPSQGGWVQP